MVCQLKSYDARRYTSKHSYPVLVAAYYATAFQSLPGSGRPRVPAQLPVLVNLADVRYVPAYLMSVCAFLLLTIELIIGWSTHLPSRHTLSGKPDIQIYTPIVPIEEEIES